VLRGLARENIGVGGQGLARIDISKDESWIVVCQQRTAVQEVCGSSAPALSSQDRCCERVTASRLGLGASPKSPVRSRLAGDGVLMADAPRECVQVASTVGLLKVSRKDDDR
jgi:hypothetical protein